jgi:hypothetical protein
MAPFGFSLGGSTSKSTTNSNSTSTTDGSYNKTTTPLAPGWMSDLVQTAAGRIGNMFALDANGMIAPTNSLQDRAAWEAAGLNDANWNFSAANGLLAGAAGMTPSPYTAQTTEGASLLRNFDAYESPYVRQVVETALSDYDHGAGQTRAQQDLNLAASGAFGGSGAALTRSMTEGELARGRAATSANLRDQGFNRAAQLANLDADRRQQAMLAAADARNVASQFNANQDEAAARRQMDIARSIADNAAIYGQNQRANIQTQAQVGEAMHNLQQQQLQAPIDSVQKIVAMLSGLPLSLFVGQSEQGVNSQREVNNSTSKTKGLNVSGGVSVGGSGG